MSDWAFGTIKARSTLGTRDPDQVLGSRNAYAREHFLSATPAEHTRGNGFRKCMSAGAISPTQSARCAMRQRGGFMEALLLGIDGTGPLNDKSYRAEMLTSFVNYIVRN